MACHGSGYLKCGSTFDNILNKKNLHAVLKSFNNSKQYKNLIVYTHTHTHTHIHTNTLSHSLTHTHAYTHKYTHSHTHTYSHIHSLSYMRMHTRTHIHTVADNQTFIKMEYTSKAVCIQPFPLHSRGKH